MEKHLEELYCMVERRTPLVEEVLQKVWDYAETALEEYQASHTKKENDDYE